MAAQIAIRPQACPDQVPAAAYIARISARAAERFLSAAQSAFERLAEMPGIGSSCKFDHPAPAGIRFMRVRGFPKHLIFYRPTASGIEVIRVLHGARDILRVLDQDLP